MYELDAKYYEKNSRSQKRLAENLLKSIDFSGNEQILDIGCGDGRITQDILNYIPNGTILGIDLSMSMISLARAKNTDEVRLKYECLKIEDFAVQDKFDLILSFSCFHWVKDKEQAFENVHNVLQKNGKIYVLTYLYSESLVEPIYETLQKKQYKKYLVSRDKLEQFYSIKQYDELSRKYNMKLYEYQIMPEIIKFDNAEAYGNHFKGFHPVTQLLPKNEIETFFLEVGARSLKYIPENSDGGLHHLLPAIILKFKHNEN